MPEKILKCYGCKESFPKSQLVNYTPIRAKKSQNYCPKCLEEKKAREQFSEKVCAIFGLKMPGPRIWTERKRLMENYGYTDSIIINCLDYIYNVEKKRKLSESLILVNPDTINKMMQYKKIKQEQNEKIISAMNTQSREFVVPINENISKKDNKWNINDWLDD